MGKSGYEQQEDSIRFFRLEEGLADAKKRISELEETIEKLAPLIRWITPEKQIVTETKYIPVKCEKRFDFAKDEMECIPMKQLNGTA